MYSSDYALTNTDYKILQVYNGSFQYMYQEALVLCETYMYVMFHDILTWVASQVQEKNL